MGRHEKYREEDLLALLEKGGEISVRDAAKALGLSSHDEGERKGLQRLLKKLVEQGKAEAQGTSRARVYRRKGTADEPRSPEAAVPAQSAKALALRRYVDLDPKLRKHVGYHPQFLAGYRPNKDFYLPEKQRARLLKIGRAETGSRPAGTYARNILERLLVDLAWNSSRLEGNTYSLLQTRALIQQGAAAAGKNAEETQMILNHKAAIEFVVRDAEELEISKYTICNIHALLSENLLGSSDACGRIRQIPVAIGASTYVPLDGGKQLEKQLDLFVDKARAIRDPFEQSLFSLVHLSYLQAFEDVNKRTSRLLANVPLIQANLRPLSFADVPELDYLKALIGVYEKNDTTLIEELYIWAYERSAQKYSAIQQSMGPANLLNLKYREPIHSLVQAAVKENLKAAKVGERALALGRKLGLPLGELQELTELIQTELADLHEGNIARYQLSRAEFLRWKKGR